jgi:hypothetical protein
VHIWHVDMQPINIWSSSSVSASPEIKHADELFFNHCNIG